MRNKYWRINVTKYWTAYLTEETDSESFSRLLYIHQRFFGLTSQGLFNRILALSSSLFYFS
jgi:hypothetical protein